jgi:hypothetical protein
MFEIDKRRKTLRDPSRQVVADVVLPAQMYEKARELLPIMGEHTPAELGAADALGSLGETIVELLRQKGVDANVEGETVHITAAVPSKASCLILQSLGAQNCVTMDSWIEAKPGKHRWYERGKPEWYERWEGGWWLKNGRGVRALLATNMAGWLQDAMSGVTT